MEPDSAPSTRTEPVDGAHLREPGESTSVVHRHPVPPDLADLARRYWIPVWSVPPGEASVQRVLQHPVALIIVTAEYARFYGVATGLSTTTLVGHGWGVGVLLQPAAGALLTGGSMVEWTDRHAELAEVFGDRGAALAAAVRGAMATAPDREEVHRAAMAEVDGFLRACGPVDDEGRLVNEVVSFVEDGSDVVRVAQVAAAFGLSERAVQRLTRRRLGVSPKWVIQRRRLHEASVRLRDVDGGRLADLAAELGYADQAHLTRDFRTATGMTPGEWASRFS